MASIITRKSKSGRSRYTIQFDLGRKRPCVSLGNLNKSQAQQAKGYIESLVAVRRNNVAMDGKTAAWLAGIGDNLYARLVGVGLVDPRLSDEGQVEPQVAKLGQFIDAYIASRSSIKASTIVHLKRSRYHLCAYFGEDCSIATISPGDADEFREHLSKTLAENTVRRICGRAKQFFRYAVRKRLISESPFGDMKGTSVTANRSRDYFISREEADAILKACPDNQWKLIFALSRYGGLRCPSEHLGLTWGDVNWDRERMTAALSEKTAITGIHKKRLFDQAAVV